jgi:hypothetical protein
MGTDKKHPLPSFQQGYQIAHIIVMKMNAVQRDLATPSLNLFNYREGKGQDMPEDAYRKDLSLRSGTSGYPFKKTAGIVPDFLREKKIEESYGIGSKAHKKHGPNPKNEKEEPDVPITGGLFFLL